MVSNDRRFLGTFRISARQKDADLCNYLRDFLEQARTLAPKTPFFLQRSYPDFGYIS